MKLSVSKEVSVPAGGRAVLAALWLVLMFVPLAPANSRPIRAAELRCEYRQGPLGIDEPAPRLMWIVTAEHRAAHQSAYRILVASTPRRLAAEEGDLWDSGRVRSAASSQIPYAGGALTSRQACHWKVMLWNGGGAPGPWSAPARWEMGLLKPTDWNARWIDAAATHTEIQIEQATYYATEGDTRADVTAVVRAAVEQGRAVVAKNDALGGDPAPNIRKRLEVRYRVGDAALRCDVAEGATAPLPSGRIPYLRTRFKLDEPAVRARLYASALGLYELHINGQRVGDHYLAPGWTDYRKRVRYQTFDVTDLLQRGENVLGGIVGPGWFAGRAGLFDIRGFYGPAPALLAQLEITTADGTTRIGAGADWRRCDGPLLQADLFDGVICDARQIRADWSRPSSSDDGWEAVALRDEKRTLEAQVAPPVRILAELPSRAITEPRPGRWTFDLGQNMVGVVRLRASAPAGAVLTVRHGELLAADGTIYTANLRSASATDVYICRGEGVETWQPPFTFHGFRYVEITGLPDPPAAETVTGIVLGSDLPPAGTFACSDERINQLQRNIVWGLRGNFVSIPTDCPQRDERMGWMGDAQVFAPTAAYNAEIAAFMTKWMTDVADAQRGDGAHSDVAPVTRGLNYGTPAWADAGVIVPWALYQRYGDTRILERHVDSMIRWVEWRRAHSDGLVCDRDRGGDYGDWLSIGADTPKDLIGTAYFAHSTDLLARTLRALRRDEDAREYERLFDEIRAAFVHRFVSAAGHVAGGTQTATALALRFDLLPEDLRPKALDQLVADVRGRGVRLTTGFVGVSHLLHVLDDHGRPDMADHLLRQDVFPSWLYSVRHGATTIWERWDGWTPQTGPHPDHGMNSFNHYALGSCGAWLFEGVAGIRPDPDHPGWETFTIRPHLGAGLTSAAATHDSIRGRIASAWRVDRRDLDLDVTIPANTTATVHVPAAAGAEVREGGLALESASGVTLLRRTDRAAVLRVGSGTYRFRSTRPPTRAGNPILPGWYADPEVAVWIYPTCSAPYDEQLHFDAFSSPDLVTWTRHGSVLESTDVLWAHRALWAPSVVERDGRYFFFFSANDIQNDEQAGGIGVAVSDSPAGPFRDYLGKPLIDAFHNGAQPIDPFFFRDADGQDYLIYGGWGHCNIARLRPDFTIVQPLEDGASFREITPAGYVAGPFMFIRDGRYYFMWSEGGRTAPDCSVAYAIADSPLGPFERVGNVLSQDPGIATGAGRHSVLKIPGRDEYLVIYHRRPLGETDGNHRVVCIDRMTFDADGRIEPVKLTFEGVAMSAMGSARAPASPPGG